VAFGLHVGPAERLAAAALGGRRAASERLAAQCGVVMMSFGENYTRIAMKAASRTRGLQADKGWCPLDPELDHVPVTLFTDAPMGAAGQDSWQNGSTSATMLERSESFNGVVVRSVEELAPWAGPNTSGALNLQLGTWRTRWYHAQVLLRAPYALALYLDVDALPCSAHGLSRLLRKLTDAGAYVGAPMVAAFLRCQMTHGDCRSPHPAGLGPRELEEWGNFTERNSGVVAVDLRHGRPVVEEFASAIQRAAASQVSGDQYPLREALFKFRHSVPQVTYDDREVCRYVRPRFAECETREAAGCAVHHMHRMGSLSKYKVI